MCSEGDIVPEIAGCASVRNVVASISFYANNFLNNMGQVFSTKTETYSSVTSYIPSFYYGLTLRLKF